jgi:hypothetical protein
VLLALPPAAGLMGAGVPERPSGKCSAGVNVP